jgi:SPP1 family predicted phage head-tail adaptor
LLLQKPVEVRTPSGATKTTYEDVDEVWSAVTPLSGQTLYYAQQFAPKATAHIVLRYRSDIEEAWRLVTVEGIPYIVRAEPVDVEHKQALLLLYCEALQV